ncbi:hypothetical protein BD410DRAFT_635878 [Rickenella mellea]|uniref:Uncharacterized protein n=1 Tax=Rickenella mellea TaxID=50990 RepID=A0A4Y7QDA5_9AGAM|nr:hypothetical protein BD410DRAFT_635878 [Rickenella mellea]
MYIDAPISSDEIIKCLYHTPALTSLELHRGWLNDAVIQALTLDAWPAIPHNNICPELQRIELHQWDTCLMSMDVMKEMILSRWGGVVGQMISSDGRPDNTWERKLRSIILNSFDFGDDRDIAEERSIAVSIEEGLQVQAYPSNVHRQRFIVVLGMTLLIVSLKMCLGVR